MSFADRSVFSRFFLDVIFVNLAGCGVGCAPVRSGPAACRRNGFGNRFRRAAANRFRSSVRYLRPGRSRYGRIPVHGGCGGRPVGKCRSRISTRAGRLRRPLPPRSCGARCKAKRRSSGRFRSHRRGRLRYRRGRNRTGPVPGKADRVRVARQLGQTFLVAGFFQSGAFGSVALHQLEAFHLTGLHRFFCHVLCVLFCVFKR